MAAKSDITLYNHDCWNKWNVVMILKLREESEGLPSASWDCLCNGIASSASVPEGGVGRRPTEVGIRGGNVQETVVVHQLQKYLTQRYTVMSPSGI